MKVDAIRLDLRPRSMFEAADLGVRLVSAHLRSVAASCAPVYAFVLVVAASSLAFGTGWSSQGLSQISARIAQPVPNTREDAATTSTNA